jgi:hypothetical protein
MSGTILEVVFSTPGPLDMKIFMEDESGEF